MSPAPFRVVVFASGAGSNFAALARAVDAGHCRATLSGVVTDRPEAPVLARAEAAGLNTRVVPYPGKSERPQWNEALASAASELGADLVVLAGFMRILGPEFLDRFTGRIINVHPSLLPAFPGVRAPADALAAGARITGCTVHVVDRGVDTGPILAQAAVPIFSDDTDEALHDRIRTLEHRLLPATIDAIARGAIVLGVPPRIAEARREAESSERDFAALVSPSFLGWHSQSDRSPTDPSSGPPTPTAR